MEDKSRIGKWQRVRALSIETMYDMRGRRVFDESSPFIYDMWVHDDHPTVCIIDWQTTVDGNSVEGLHNREIVLIAAHAPRDILRFAISCMDEYVNTLEDIPNA